MKEILPMIVFSVSAGLYMGGWIYCTRELAAGNPGGWWWLSLYIPGFIVEAIGIALSVWWK